MSKSEIFNSIFLRRRRKVIIDCKGDIDDLYKQYIENNLKNNDLISNSEHSIIIKKCDLLNCSLLVDNTLFDFENGNLKKEIKDEDVNFVKGLTEIVEEATKMVRTKLNVALTLNENISKLGFCMDTELLKIVAMYDEKEISKFSDSLIADLKQLVGANVEYISLFPNFPQQVIEMDFFTVHFYRWLYYVNICFFGNNCIPYNFEVIEKEKTEIKDLDLKVISVGTEKDFYDMMVNIMNSPEALSPQDLSDIEYFVNNDKDHLKYIPETIINKENLANICNLLLKYHPEPLVDVISPKFKNVNDVLRLALVLSGNNASDIGKSVRFKSFKQSERRLLMELLNNCVNRYEDFMKYKNMWKRFCERIHPRKFKNIYPDLVEDLLGDYNVMGYIKDKKHELKCYNTMYRLNEQNNGLSFKNLICLNPFNYINTQYQECFKTYKNLKQVPEDVKENVGKYIEKVEKCINKNKMVNKGAISSLNKELINDRIKDLKSEIQQLKEKGRQYRSKRPSFNSEIVKLISDKKINEAATILSIKPGIYLRHLDELITKSENHDVIIELFERVAAKASVKVLLSVKGYFQKRTEKLKYRAFLIKGSDGSKKKAKHFNSNKIRGRRVSGQLSKPATVVYYTDKVKPPLEIDLCDRIVQICDRSLITLFEDKPKLRGVYVHPDFQRIYIPQDIRNASSSLESYTKGSRFDLSFKNITPEEKEQMISDAEDKLQQNKNGEQELKNQIKNIEELLSDTNNTEIDRDENKNKLTRLNKDLEKVRQKIKVCEEDLEDKKHCPIGNDYNKIRVFIWWTNSSNYSNDIIDLSVLVFNDKFESLTRVAWNQLKNDAFRIYHSGDFINGGKVEGKGVSEFIDLDTETIVERGGRYVVVGVLSYSGPNLKQFPNCKFGWMERQDLKSNEFYEPATVRQKIEVKYDGKAACPVIIDCKTRELIWIDTILAKDGIHLCIEQLVNNIQAILAYYTNPIRVSMYDLIHLHINARDGKQIEDEKELQEGDTAFVPCIPYSKKEGVNYIASSDLDIILSEYMC